MTKQELEDVIRRANHAYWVNNSPIISDEEYDTYVEELRTIDPNNDLVNYVGGVKGKYKHNPPMLSLNKAYNYEVVITWATNVSRSSAEMIKMQPKYDGLAGKIENGKLSTRGDGYVGEDITTHKKLVSVEHVINDPTSPDGCVVRRYEFDKFIKLIENQDKQICGELLITNDVFKEYFESGKILRADGQKYSNPRNAVAGLFNQKDISNIPENIVTFVPYNTHSFLTTLERLPSVIDGMISDLCKEFKPKYPLDGIVFKLADEVHYNSLGNTAHHPRGAIAYKFTNSSGQGYVRDVVWQAGKECLTPVLELEEPVVLSNCNITRATLHNYKFFKDLNLRKGSIVRIEKAGDIIPKVVEVIEHSDGELIEAPTKCFWCDSALEVKSVELCCSNPDCVAKRIPRLVYAAKILNLDGFGQATVSLLVTRFNIHHLYELLETNYWYEIGHLPGFTDYSAELLANQIKMSVGNVTEAQVLASMCVPGIGLELSKKILEQWSYKDLFIDNEVPLFYMGALIGANRCSWIKDAYATQEDVFRKAYEYFKPQPLVKVADDVETVCFTGKFEIPRQQCQQYVEEHNMKFTDTMSSGVSCLVIPNTEALDKPSSKIKYATKHDIPILTFEQFKQRFTNERR